MGEQLIMIGYVIIVISVLTAIFALMLWRDQSRRLRTRMRETYGEECCRDLRQSGLDEARYRSQAKGAVAPK